jgi:uncharacterized protein
MIEEKERNLKKTLSLMGRALVAFSGGADSTFLLYTAGEAMGRENVLAVIAQSPTYPAEEIEDAIKLADRLGVECRLIDTEELQDENFVSNSPDRCYFCKKELFCKLQEIASEAGIEHVLDGSNIDDLEDYRPGARAKKEFGVRSPLEEASLNKHEIRQLSQRAGLPTWDKPSLACLSSRIPYGRRITTDILNRINEAETFIRSLGLKQVRVRDHEVTARIEVGEDELPLVMKDSVRAKITKKLEELGYFFVTLDLKGYRSGSLNETLD